MRRGKGLPPQYTPRESEGSAFHQVKFLKSFWPRALFSLSSESQLRFHPGSSALVQFPVAEPSAGSPLIVLKSNVRVCQLRPIAWARATFDNFLFPSMSLGLHSLSCRFCLPLLHAAAVADLFLLLLLLLSLFMFLLLLRVMFI